MIFQFAMLPSVMVGESAGMLKFCAAMRVVVDPVGGCAVVNEEVVEKIAKAVESSYYVGNVIF